jgi:hypothetical protein
MAAHCQNPHSLSQSTTRTARAQVFGSEGDEERTNGGDHPALLQRLGELVQEALGHVNLSFDIQQEPRRKLRKKGKSQKDLDVQDVIR